MHPNGLQIIAYYDEVETCNPLGSSSKKYKLGCIFFTLGNIRPFWRSSLKAIFLAAVAKSSTNKTNGIDAILQPFIDDLKEFSSSGITIDYGGTQEVWKGALIAFLADNLASHEIGGFKESFSFSNRFCRSCTAKSSHSQTYFNEKFFQLVCALPHDIMHDLMEGVIPHEITFLLNSCVTDGLFELSQLNDRISVFH